MSRVFFFIFVGAALFGTSAPAFADSNTENLIQRSVELKLAQNQEWLDLLHFRPNVFGLIRSQVQGEAFFLSPLGYKDSEAELQADLRGLLKNKNLEDANHPICKFPSRKKWLQEKLNIPEESFPKPICSLYHFYRDRMKYKSISLVFSSYYADSPSSAFGHSFFRVNNINSTSSEHNELLDWGIGYAGQVDAKNGFDYIYKGISGGFKGVYSSVPYYRKVREYNDFESRDLWSYELNLSDAEIDSLLNHIWELGDNHFNYYFFTQNCGFHTLTALESAVPRLRLTDKVPFWVSPTDALKAVMATPGLVKSVSLRPALFSQMKSDLALLSETQSNYFDDLRDAPASHFKSTPENMTAEEKAQVIDVYLENFDFQNAKKMAAADAEILRERNLILAERAKLPTITPPPEAASESGPPHLSHSSVRVQLNHVGEQNSSKNSKGRTQAEFRFALHDSLDPEEGYPKYSTVEMFRFQLEKNEAANRTEISQFQLIKLESFVPSEPLRRQGSWGLGLGLSRVYEPNCMDCKLTEFRLGYGISTEIRPKTFFAYAMFYNRMQFGQDVENGFSDIVEPEVGLMGQAGSWAYKFSLSPKYSISGNKKSWIYQNLELRRHFSHETYLRLVSTQQDYQNSYEFGVGFFF